MIKNSKINIKKRNKEMQKLKIQQNITNIHICFYKTKKTCIIKKTSNKNSKIEQNKKNKIHICMKI